MPAVLLGQKETQDVKAESAEDSETNSATHVTGFLVLLRHDGGFELNPNINAVVTTERQVNGQEVKTALSALSQEISAQEIAANVVGIMQMQARAAMEAQQNQAILQQMNIGR